MNRFRWVAAVALLGFAGVANAQFSATITGASDYDFRGITQTSNDPAAQLSLDYAFSNGIYLGAWASNIDFGDCCGENVEVDYYAGITHENEAGVSFELGYIYYQYPGTDVDVDYSEVKLGIGYKGLTLEGYYSPDYFGSDLETWYVSGTYTREIAYGFGLEAHAGYSTGQYFSQGLAGVGEGDGSYIDYSIGVTKSLGNFDFALKYVDTDTPAEYRVDRNEPFSTEGRVVFTISTTLPWGKKD